jgi:hypothetical protein
MRRGKASVRREQQFEVGTERRAHRADMVDREILVAAIDKGPPRAGERIECGGGETHRLDLQPAFDTFVDRGTA